MLEARTAIIKRAETALKEAGVQIEGIDKNGQKMLEGIVDKKLQGAIEKQSKEFIAQVGRVASYSIDNQDIRGNEKLHGKYTEKANKMNSKTFDANAKKALEYEKSKDEKGKGKSFLYNLFYRKPLQLLNKLIPEDKPLLSPGQKALVGLIALAVLAPPFGAIAAAFMFFSATKDVYKGSKLQKWVNDKFFTKIPDKLNSEELEKVTAKGLAADIQKVQDKKVQKVEEKQKSTEQKIEGVQQTTEKVANTQDRPKTANPDIKNVGTKMQDMSKKSPLDSKAKEEVEKIAQKVRQVSGKKSVDLEDFQSAKGRLDNERAHQSKPEMNR